MQNTLAEKKPAKSKNMEFVEKKSAYDKLIGVEYFEHDVKLLKSKNPASPFITGEIIDKKQGQSDVLWDLLDHATVAEIEKNRPALKAEKGGGETAGEQEARIIAKKKRAKIEAVKTLLETDLKKAPQKVLAKIARAIPEIGEAAADFKGDTLRPLLFAFAEKQTPQVKTNLPPASGELVNKKKATYKTSTDKPEKKSVG